MTENASDEAYNALKDSILQALPDDDVLLQNLGTNRESIENAIAENPGAEKRFTEMVQAGGGGGENGERVAGIIDQVAGQLVDETDQETLEIIAEMSPEELQTLIEQSLQQLGLE